MVPLEQNWPDPTSVPRWPGAFRFLFHLPTDLRCLFQVETRYSEGHRKQTWREHVTTCLPSFHSREDQEEPARPARGPGQEALQGNPHRHLHRHLRPLHRGRCHLPGIFSDQIAKYPHSVNFSDPECRHLELPHLSTY